MGTNYYWHESGERECKHCRQETPKLHIGKSSGGWAFSLRVHPFEEIRSFADWQDRWASGGAIFDECGDSVCVAQMLSIITERSHPSGLRHHTPENMGPFSGYLDTQPGPSGATYDLCNYEFS